MAYPFVRWPSLREYLDWAVTAGCTVTPGIWTDQYLIPHRTITIDGPNGGYQPLTDPDENERLSPSEVKRFDRRLGVVSPFPGIYDC
jgi:hypothetical protein